MVWCSHRPPLDAESGEEAAHRSRPQSAADSQGNGAAVFGSPLPQCHRSVGGTPTGSSWRRTSAGSTTATIARPPKLSRSVQSRHPWQSGSLHRGPNALAHSIALWTSALFVGDRGESRRRHGIDEFTQRLRILARSTLW